MTIRILIVEDRQEIRVGLQMRLTAESDLLVVGAAGDGAEAIDLAGQLLPDVVLMDVEMPVQTGIETSRQLHVSFPEIPVVVLTIHDDPGTRNRCKAAHVAGFVSKEKPVDCLIETIRQVTKSGAQHRQL